MKKRILAVSILLAMILTGCGDSASGTGQSVQIHESTGKEDNVKEEEAREEKQPLVKVSGGGGFYIEGSVSELEKASLKIGQEVTVNDWNSGNTYTGEVVSISDFPAENDN